MIKGRVKFLKDWPDWDIEIHERQKQIDRQGRSLHYPFTFKINEKKEVGRFSSTSILPYYDTTLSSCTCFDFEERKLPCKHIYRLAVELGYIEIINRPTYDKEAIDKIKASDDVDSQLDQIKRQKSALKCNPIEIDFENKCGTFEGSGKSPYHTTLTECTCRDYFVRRLPCKHIYRLRSELEKIENK